MVVRRMLRRWIRFRSMNQAQPKFRYKSQLRLRSLEERAVPTTYTVNTLIDENDGIGVGGVSLRDAIGAANVDGSAGPHIINFSVAGSINLLTGHILIDAPQGLSITGPGAASLSVKGITGTAGASNRIFDINVAAGNPTISISGVTLADGNLTSGNNGGAIRVNNDPVELTNVVVTNNKTASSGGAIATAVTGGQVTITGSTISFNNSTSTGGAIFTPAASTATITINNSMVNNNVAGSTGGVMHGTVTTTLNISSSTISQNSSTGTGGAFNLAGTATITINNALFNGNQSTSNGAGLQTSGVATSSITFTTFDGNIAGGSGGGFYHGGNVNLTIEDCIFTNNKSTVGGGFRTAGSNSTVTLNRSLLSGNEATSTLGGGAYFGNNGPVNINDCTFMNNIAKNGGGGMRFSVNTATINNTTISGNTANGSTSVLGGGAIFVSGATTITINNSTITKNNVPNAVAKGGGIFLLTSTSSITLNSTIVADNSNANQRDISSGGTLPRAVHGSDNLFGAVDPGVVSLTGTNALVGTEGAPIDPLLNAIGSNGGPTPTHLPIAGSPVFNAGSNVASLPFDQRGSMFPRLLGSQTDIGSVESDSGGPIAPTAKATSSDVPPATATYVVTVTYTDDIGINTDGIDLNDIRVTGIGYAAPEAPISKLITSGSKGDMTVTVDYTFNAPPGGWDFGDNGKYSILMEANQVSDTEAPANPVSAGPKGTFTVGMPLPSPMIVDSAGDGDDSIYTAGNLTLREAIRLTNAELGSNTITFAGGLTGQTINVASVMKITDPVVVTGPGAANLTLSGGGTSRIFEVAVTGTGGDVSISGLTLTAGNATTGTGGAISVVDESLTLNGMVFNGNTITGTGGAIGVTGAASLNIGNSTFTSNTASSTGGAINLATAATVTLNQSQFDANTSNSTGGAIQGTSTVSLNAVDCVFSNNNGTNGGALRFASIAATTITLDRCTVSGNTASGLGGGIYMSTAGNLNVRYSTFSGNTSGTGGGAIRINGVTTTISNSTISGNTSNGTSATTGGGGILNAGTPAILIQNSTITNNSAPNGTAKGGGIFINSTAGTVTLHSVILAGNSNPNQRDLSASGARSIAGDNNLIGAVDPALITLSGTNDPTLIGTEASPVDPVLEALSNNGGPTLTHKLLPGSGAFNAGNNLAGLMFDQRGNGFPRTIGAFSDIGALEVVTAIPSAKAILPDVPPANPTYTVTVDYVDETGISTISIDTNDVRLSGSGFVTPVAPISASFTGGGTTVTATYVFNVPGGSWDYTDNGTYTLTMEAGQVVDTDGPNAVPAGPLGSFDVGMAVPALVVDNGGDAVDFNYGPGQLTLREAIHLVNYSLNTNDSISFAGSLTGQTISLGSVLKITDPVQITGLGAANLALSGGGASRVFELNVPGAGGDVSLSGMTVTGGNATTGVGGGITLTDENLTLTGMVVTGNSITGAGGGIGATGAATITVGNSTISSNTASTTGAGIHLGGIGTISVNNSTLNGNMATTTGGAIHTASTVTLNISDSTISNNSGSTGGGVRVINAGSTTTVTRSTVSGNTASASGGGFYITGGTTNITYSTFSGNTAASSGGGIGMSSGTITLTNSTISGNIANGTGTTGGGGISGTTAVMNINNSTITGNAAPTGAGGGIRKTSATGAVTLQSTIVGANTANAGNGQDIHGTVTITVGGDNNLVQDTVNGAFTLTGAGNVTGADPMVAGLSGNGGPTQTHALQPGSPAFNAGNNLLGLMFDQRGSGNPRELGGIPDIGSFEGVSVIPSAKATAPNVPPVLSTVTVTVDYMDETAINVVTIDLNDITISGPAFGTPAMPISFMTAGTGAKVTATYVFNAPVGGWLGIHNGSYSINMVAGQVADTDGPNSVFPGVIGTFKVGVPLPPLTVDNAGDTDDGNYGFGELTLREAIKLANESLTSIDTISFAGSLNGQTITLGSVLKVTDPLTIIGPGSDKLTISGGNLVRLFEVDIPGKLMPLDISGLTLTGGKSTTGAAIQVADDALAVSRSVVSLNAGSSTGGAITISSGGTVTVDDSWFDQNTSTAGGAITVLAGGGLLVTDSLFTKNAATSGNAGGGIRAVGTLGSFGFTVRNSTFSENTSGFNGGAIGFGDAFVGTATIQNCTIINNSVSGTGGGGGVGANATATSNAIINIESSIISGNLVTGTGVGPDLFGSASITFNITKSLIGSSTGATVFVPDATTTALLGQAPQLDPLADNGGPTKTFALQATSPAKNQGSNPAGLSFDQRGTGFARDSGGGVDIGAFEIQAAAPPQVTGILVNNGAAQRSLVTSMKVSFSEPVNLAAGAFVLQRYANGTAGTIGLIINQVGNDVTLTFNNTGTIVLDPGSSLPDGTYELTIVANNVTGTLGGGTLDGNKNGTAQGSPVDDVSSKLHRLFGDGNGDGGVNSFDFALFRGVFGLSGPSAFDFNNDNSTNNFDFAQFRARFGLSGYQP